MRSCFLLELFWKKWIFLGLLADFHFSNNLVDIFLSFSSLSLFLAWLFKLLKVLLYLLTDDCHKFIHIWFQVSHGIYHIWLFITQSSTHNFFFQLLPPLCHLYWCMFFSVPLGSQCVHMLIVCPSAIWRSTIWSAKHPCHLSCSNLPLSTSPASPASCCKTTDMRCLSVNIQPPHSLYCIFFSTWYGDWTEEGSWPEKIKNMWIFLSVDFMWFFLEYWYSGGFLLQKWREEKGWFVMHLMLLLHNLALFVTLLTDSWHEWQHSQACFRTF